MIVTKRIYSCQSRKDGFRILVDRLWPRGVTKEDAKINLWLREIAPSDELRKWFSHEPEKWRDFRKMYKDELRKKPELAEEIKRIENKRKKVTLLYSAKDENHNNAVALKEILQGKR